jgi:hypothetical protein
VLKKSQKIKEVMCLLLENMVKVLGKFDKGMSISAA